MRLKCIVFLFWDNKAKISVMYLEFEVFLFICLLGSLNPNLNNKKITWHVRIEDTLQLSLWFNMKQKALVRSYCCLQCNKKKHAINTRNRGKLLHLILSQFLYVLERFHLARSALPLTLIFKYSIHPHTSGPLTDNDHFCASQSFFFFVSHDAVFICVGATTYATEHSLWC